MTENGTSTNGFIQSLGAVLCTALAPILALHNFNIQYIQPPAVVRTVWVAVALAVGLFLFAWVILRRPYTAAALTILFLLLFFLYGHIFDLLSRWLPVRNLLFSGAWVLLLLVGAVWLLRHPAQAARFTQIVLVMTALVAIFNFANILTYEVARRRANQASLEQTGAIGAATDFGRPDIYYIILDAHTRPDVMARFGYDSTPFVQKLEAMGFYVASCSQANYWLTTFSVGATLRMEYFGPEYDNESALPDWKVSAALQNLRQLGYQVVTFETRANEINNQDLGEDVLLASARQETLYEDFYSLASLNDFEANVIRTTWLHSWLQLVGNYRHLLPAGVLDAQAAAYLRHYRQTNYILEQLPELASLESPKFVYAHLLVPHEPFIFDASGAYVYRNMQDDFTEGYRNNAEFIDRRIAEVIEQILANSAQPPIIILQGDHGPNGSQPDLLLPILNAYYFPYGGDEQLYDHITPVNSLRTLFSYYFGANYPRLEDLSYYGHTPNLSEGVLTPNSCVPAAN